MRESGLAAHAVAAETRCLNCGADLTGAFCSHCGQRAIPADPTVAELAGDVWQELSGYDGRVAATFRHLLHPGRLTIDYLQGRRAHYLSPIKLYLTVSVIYFLVAAATPITTTSTTEVDGPGGMQIKLTDRKGAVLSDQDRVEIAKSLEKSPWFVRPMLTSLTTDPIAFRARMFDVMPRVFFGLLPVFAAIVAMFYRKRRFPTALVFAAHLHAFAFLILTVPEASKLLRWAPLTAVAAAIAGVTLIVYTLAGLRAVYGGGWPATVAKGVGIAFVYVLASIPAFFIILIWASLV